eukprot:373289-Ditylum_brightwellii.AAC.1
MVAINTPGSHSYPSALEMLASILPERALVEAEQHFTMSVESFLSTVTSPDPTSANATSKGPSFLFPLANNILTSEKEEVHAEVYHINVKEEEERLKVLLTMAEGLDITGV